MEQLPSTVVIWKISYHALLKSFTISLDICSPCFSLNGAKEFSDHSPLFQWYLETNCKRGLSFYTYLKRAELDTTHQSEVSLKYRISLWEDNNCLKKTSCYTRSFKQNNTSFQESDYLEWDTSYQKTSNSIYDDDNFEIVCEIWNLDVRNKRSNISLKRLTSYLPVHEKFTINWQLKYPLKENHDNQKEFHANGDELSVLFSYSKSPFIDMKMDITGSLEKQSTWNCWLKLLPKDEVFFFSDFLLIYPEDLPFQYPIVPLISNEWILENAKDLISPNLMGIFVILGEDFETSSWTNEIFPNSLMFQEIKLKLQGKSDIPTLLTDMTRLHQNKTLSDFSLQVQTKSLPVHSALLIARSSVFSQMLETNMKERNEKTIIIEDMDEDTVSGMVQFIYTDDPGELDTERAINLYYAGDKYEIDGLVKMSSDYLQKNLTISNVSDVLEMADQHNNEELMSFVLEYFLLHRREISQSPEFRSFSKRNPSLAAQTLLNVMDLEYRSETVEKEVEEENDA